MVSAGTAALISAPTASFSGSRAHVDAAITNFTGVVQCTALIASAVVSSSYTPGAGNIW